jgi:signal peptidase II
MPTFVNRALSYSRLLIFGAIILLLDQISKYWVIQNIEYGTYHFPPPIPVIDGFFYLVHIGNKGAAWGMFHGYQLQLAIFALVSIACIYLFRKALLLHKANMQIVFGLIIGGIIGNFWDRIAHGHVVDFFRRPSALLSVARVQYRGQCYMCRSVPFRALLLYTREKEAETRSISRGCPREQN